MITERLVRAWRRQLIDGRRKYIKKEDWRSADTATIKIKVMDEILEEGKDKK